MSATTEATTTTTITTGSVTLELLKGTLCNFDSVLYTTVNRTSEDQTYFPDLTGILEPL